MKKTKLTRSLLAACSIVALSAVMYGCVHDGGDDDRADTGMETPMPVAVDLSGIAADAMVEAGTADIAAGMSADIGEITFSCAAGGDDCSVTVDANGNAMATGGTVTAANSAAYTTRKEEAAAAIVAATKAAGTKEMAIAAEATQGPGQTPLNDDAGLGGSAADGSAVTTYSMTIERDRMATTIKITDTALAGDDDPKFMQAMDLGGGTTMHVRTMEADDDGNVAEEVVMVTTDIEEPDAVDFAKWESGLDGATPQALNADLDTLMDADNNGTANDDLTGLWVGADATTAPDEAVRMLVMSDAFAAGSGATVVHTFARYQLDSDNVADGNQTVQAFTTPGTYNGTMGTYRCGNNATTADCTVTVDDEGAITAMSAGWVFIPGTDAKTDQPDYDFLHYGFWLQKTTDEDGVVEYDEVETFAGSSVAVSGDVSNVLGTASYTGGATGVYVHAAINPDGTRASATSGHFTADASLTATFGQVPVSATDTTGTIAPSLLNSVSGTIDNFMLSGHDTGPGWSVSLEQGDITTSDGTFSGVAKGGGTDGSYSGTFHGPVAAVEGVVPHPHSAVGEFNANFSNGTVAGGFGARKDD